jgi:hypothetical protein
MKNFFKCVVLGLIAAVVPVCLTVFTLTILPDQAVSIIGGVVLALMAMGTVYSFFTNQRNEDAFWLSLFVCASFALVYNVGVALWGWFGTENFAALPFAFAPVLLTIAYACLLGVIAFGMRLHYVAWNMTGTEKGLSWSLIGVLGFFMLGMLEEVGARYFGLNLPGWLKTTIISAGVFSIVSMAFCAGKLICKK